MRNAAKPPVGHEPRGFAAMAAHFVRPCISLPADLDALRRAHASRLPPLSDICAAAVRAALEGLGDVDLPPPPPPSRTAAATLARSRKRREPREP